MNDDDKNQNITNQPVAEQPSSETVEPEQKETEQENADTEKVDVPEPTLSYDELPTEESKEVAAEPELKTEEPEQAAVEPVVNTDNTTEDTAEDVKSDSSDPNAKWYVVHTYSGHENKVAGALKQRVESEHLEHKIIDVLVPTQDKIEIKAGKKENVKEKIFPGYILVKMVLDDASWLAVRTTQGVTSFVGIGNKPTPIPEHEVKTIVKFMTQGATSTFKDVYAINDTIKIIDGPFSEFIGKVDTVDKEKGKVRVLVSIFGRETPVELDFLQVQKL